MRKNGFLVIAVLLIVLMAGVTGSLYVWVEARAQQSAVAPVVLSPEGEVVADHDPAAPFEIQFSQPMDRASVEAAIQLSAGLTYTVDWKDDSTLLIHLRGLGAGGTYHVALGVGAQSLEGVPLSQPVSWTLLVAADLTISSVQPDDGAEGVPLDSPITVVFSQPVVPLGTELDRADLPQPLTFEPDVAGRGRWVGNSIYRFTPSDGLAPATTYRVTVSADLTGMAAPFEWSFTTVEPYVLRYSPLPVPPGGDRASLAARPTEAVKIAFAQPMDRESVEEALEVAYVSDGLGAVEGTVRWFANTLVFTPRTPWERGSVVRVSLTGALAAGGVAMEPLEWEFPVIEELRLVSSDPSDGAEDVFPSSSLVLRFSAPLDRETFLDYVEISPEPEYLYTYWEGESAVYLDFGPKADTTYEVTLDAELRDLTGWRLGEDVVITFTTGDWPPSYQLLDSWQPWAFGDQDEPRAFVTYRNVETIEFALYSMSLADFMGYYGDDWRFREEYTPSPADLLREWTVKTDAPRNQSGSLSEPLVEGGGTLPPGLYFLTASTPETRRLYSQDQQRQVVIVAANNVTFKWAGEQGMAWVTDWDEGTPVPGVTVSFLDAAGRVTASGVSGSDGVVMGDLAAQEPWMTHSVVVGEPGSEDFGLALSTWTTGISPWRYEVYQSWYTTPYTLYLYTDRPIYRPGQTVYFKGIVRLDDDARYQVPTDLPPFELVAVDPQGQEIMRETFTLNEMGTFHGSLVLAEDAPLGTFNLWVPSDQLETGFGASFQVAEYRRPDFEVTVTPDQDEYVQGDEISVLVESAYYFGGPVADAEVEWTVLTQDWFFDWTGEGYYDFTDYDYLRQRTYFGPYGEVLTEGTGRTDADGRFMISLPADIAERTVSQTFTIEATITDVNAQEVSGRASVVVHSGEFYLGLRPLSYVTAVDQEATVEVISVDADSQPVPERTVELTFYEHRWYNVRQKVDGYFQWKTTEEDIEVARETVQTDEEGRAQASFVPEMAGTYKVVAVSEDERGNEIRSSSYLWVSGSDYVSWPVQEDYTIELIPDKKSYRVGETARVLIPSPYEGPVSVLLTTERGSILDYQVTELQGSAQVIEVPITEEFAPNVYFVAVLMRGADESASLPPFQIGFAGAQVEADALKLTLDLRPDRTGTYAPGDTAEFTITARDHEGQPVEAELSLSLVDKSVLALSEQGSRDIVEHFYSERGLGVQTAVALTLSTGDLQRQTEGGPGKGGGGGDGGGVREEFPETAYWEPEVRTDADGDAVASITLPDNLTTWTLEAKAVTEDTLVGQATVEIVATKDLLLRPVLPRFLVVGDRAQVGAVVHNNTKETLTVEVACVLEGLEGSLEPQEVTVEAGGRTLVTWDVEATTRGEATVTLSAEGGSLQDAVRQTVPVYAMTVAEVVATSGDVPPGETVQESVVLPSRYEEGELSVRVEASLVAGMIPGLEFLRHYPYECIEQTLSRFLPNVVTAQALREAGVEDFELVQGLSQQVGIGLQRLYNNQHGDGGWGWWYADASDPYLTAYVVLGLAKAQEAGYAVDAAVLDRATAFLVASLHGTQRDNKPNLDADTRAYISYVLAEAGEGDLGASVRLYEERAGLSNRGKAHLLMALAALSPEEVRRLDVLLDELEGAAILSATTTHWQDEVQWRSMGTDAVTTATVLQALSRVAPDHDLLPGAARWLMAAREQGRWQSTYETAVSIMALTEFMVARGELEAGYAWTVALNERELGSGTFDSENLDEAQTLTVDVARLLAREPNLLTLSREPVEGTETDTGAMYYSASLEYYPPAEELRPVSAGITVAREYASADGKEAGLSSAAINDTVRVKLTIVAPTDLYHVVVEDPLPAGCEGLDTSLRTTTTVGVQPEARAVDDPWGWWWFSHTEMRDDKVVLFASYLPQGTYEYTYYMRASIAGEFNVRPARAYQMYFPDVYGHSDGGTFAVENP
ncbi:MAG: Ig-like domain-containing protein [Anaerolineae bacterium]